MRLRMMCESHLYDTYVCDTHACDTYVCDMYACDTYACYTCVRDLMHTRYVCV